MHCAAEIADSSFGIFQSHFSRLGACTYMKLPVTSGPSFGICRNELSNCRRVSNRVFFELNFWDDYVVSENRSAIRTDWKGWKDCLELLTATLRMISLPSSPLALSISISLELQFEHFFIFYYLLLFDLVSIEWNSFAGFSVLFGFQARNLCHLRYRLCCAVNDLSVMHKHYLLQLNLEYFSLDFTFKLQFA